MSAESSNSWESFKEELFLLTKDRRLGKPLYVFDTVASTNDTLADVASGGAAEGTAVIAEEQTAGRGRNGRTWQSPRARGLWMSVLLRPVLPAEKLGSLSLGAALAVCRAIRRVAPVTATIKWPNDVFVGDRKVAGVLLESRFDTASVSFVVIGMGINVSQTAEEFPPELQDAATSLESASGNPVSRAELANAVLVELEHIYAELQSGNWERVREEVLAFSFIIGRRVSVRSGPDCYEGVAFDFSDDGGLVIREDSGLQRHICAGDILLL